LNVESFAYIFVADCVRLSSFIFVADSEDVHAETGRSS